MTDDLVKASSQGLAAAPDYIPKGVEGLEHITKEDIKLPTLKIAQAISPEVTEGNAAKIEGLKPGDFFNSLLGTNYGRGPLEFCFVRGDKPHFIEFVPRELGGGVKDFNVPPNDPRTKFTTDPTTGKSVKPVASKIYDFIIMLLPSRELLALSLSSMGLKVATSINGLITARQRPIYTGKYTMQSVPKTAPKGTYFGHVIRNADWLDPETLAFAQSVYEGVKDKVLVVEREPGDDDIPDEI